jgi:POT family proton-dependent oligopeptide transporter
MAKNKYLTAPLASDKMPAGIPYILVNEAAERFAFYGTRCILTVFMTQYLLNSSGLLEPMAPARAREWFHFFVFAVYFMPLLGALLSDILLGKFRTIILFSLVYCVGVIALTVDHTRFGLALGLSLIAIGSGVIKPCVSANVGDQFGSTNKRMISKVYNWFYWSINLGAFVSNFFIPELLNYFGPKYGPTVAFGIPAGLMILATVAFWLGRWKFVHIPRAGISFVKECFSGEGLSAILRLAVIYFFIAPFWAIYDQMDSAWVLLATKLNLRWMWHDWQPSQIVSANPLLILILIPVFSYIIYPSLNRLFRLTPLRKIGIGLFLITTPFAISGLLQTKIKGGDVFKYSSQSTIAGLEPVHLLDGLKDGTSWSSAGPPSPKEPAEVIISLRERKAWRVNAIGIDTATTLSEKEIIAAMDQLIGNTMSRISTGSQSPQSDALRRRVERLKAAVTEAARAAKEASRAAPRASRRETSAKAAKDVATAALKELGMDPTALDSRTYAPREITAFLGDFSDKLVPEPYFELPDANRPTDPAEYAIASGWTLLGHYTLDEPAPNAGVTVLKNFQPALATHVMIQIDSNYGADRVKLAEITVSTDQPVPADADASTAKLWPNVAAIGPTPSVGWMFLAYVLLTSAEILVSITCLEFSYTQAPIKMKSFIMAIFLLSISLGNIFTAIVNAVIASSGGASKLAGANYYWFFIIVMLVTAILYIPVAARYKEKSYIHDEAAEEDSA